MQRLFFTTVFCVFSVFIVGVFYCVLFLVFLTKSKTLKTKHSKKHQQ